MGNIDFAKLAEPFEYDDIEWRAGATNQNKTEALALAYITSRAVMNRLDEVCGPENWHDIFAPGPNGGLACGIAIRVDGEWITKWDGADNSNIEGVKGGFSDAFKRAAVKWGIGRYLYELDGEWVACKERGRTVVLTGKPKLPDWALPKGNTNGKAQKPAAQKAKGVTDADLKTAKGTRLGDMTADQLISFVEFVDGLISKGEVISEENSKAYNGAKRLLETA